MLAGIRLAITISVVLIFNISCSTTPVYDPQTDREGIKRVIQSHHSELQACYERAIDERPGAEGKVVMSWVIEPDGRVSKIETKEAGAKIAMIAPCLSKAIAKWRFPKLAEGELQVDVSYPFFFSENGRLEVK